ncbi:MAG TPA: choice-of-anchor V domain-containing protein [Rubricoccaceae bacterium]|nr:choice-of-anchor V domain-containing protein [Rubricoccaceae bacterium]
MRRSADGRARAGLLVGLPVAVLGVAFAAMTPTSYPDRPAPGHTGGFGEPTCLACHFDGDLGPPGGVLEVEGWPGVPEPGAAYELAVRLAREDMAMAGFQLAVRTAEGAQAGTLAAADGRSAVTEFEGVAYLHHTLEGTALTGPGEAVWRFTWTAPDAPAPVRLHVAANAANGDASPLGDAIYADSLVVP